MSELPSFYEIPPISGPDYPNSVKPASLPVIKGYKIVKQLGEGGMGIVYLAEQTEPIKRKVAIKVIKPGMDSKQVIARFESERQALAFLDHPNIAHIFDAGMTESGLPYFVMEFIQGLSITKYCDQNKMSIEERLRLFQQVCDAIQHAHQKGIIHRDIKPSNILIAMQENKAIPKVIDFGVAKTINQTLTEQTLITEQGIILGTLEYISPEQASLNNADIDTRSDVYSLGILLYELLTGALPFNPKTLRKAAFDEVLRIIRDEEPPRPSAIISYLGKEATQTASLRRIDVRTLAKRLHSELEWIPLKAMHKERHLRYQTASEFAKDIQNYIDSKPLIAGPDSVAYLIKKFVKRHQYSTAVLGLLLIIVLCFGFINLYLLSKTQYAKKEAEQTRRDFNDMSTEFGDKGPEVVFLQFLELWHKDKNAQAERWATFLGEFSKESIGAFFLLDPNSSTKNEVELRNKIPDEASWFLDFIIGEQYLKDNSPEKAKDAFTRSYEKIQSLSENNQSPSDTLLINYIFAKLFSMGIDKNYAK
jgi:eukaryotic-like serine/threonine-protein kinase